MQTISADGCKISFEVRGQGKPLVLLHGFGQSRKLWSRFGWPKRLQRDYQVIAMDLRGCGQSDAPMEPESYSVENHMADYDALLSALDIETAAIWGWSLGGTVGLHLAKRRANVSFALIAGTYFGELFTETYVAKRIQGSKNQLNQVRWKGLRTWPAIEPPEIKCPMTIYSGTEDSNVVVKLEEQRNSIEKAAIELHIFEGLNHGELISKPEAIVSFIDSKLAGWYFENDN